MRRAREESGVVEEFGCVHYPTELCCTPPIPETPGCKFI
jgi:hypothetical protein